MDDVTDPSTLTKATIAERICSEIGLPKKLSLDCVEMVLERTKSALADGEEVKISGFGVFEPRQKRSRVGRNPRTLSEVQIRPRRVVTFRISNLFKSKINP